jgi:serine phosphatase RsbU (regulator of sigma subunit)
MNFDSTIIAEPQSLSNSDRKHYLVCIAGPLEGTRIEVSTGTNVLGRRVEGPMQIKDPAASGQHCRIILIGDQIMVEDLGSSNGTYIDEERITQPEILYVGSLLQIGRSVFRHEYRSKSEVEAEERQLEDLEKAAGYVRSLLPPPLESEQVEVIWQFIPSAELGGDAFGYHWLDDDHFAIYLVDVCGHGTAPALHAVSVINVLRKMSLPEVDFSQPEDVLKALNRAYQMEDHASMYFTLWYGIYSPKDRKLSYASGGHPPALLLQADSDFSQKLVTPNLGVGMLSGVSFSSKSVDVPPDSRLYIYSDGVFEVVTKDGEEWRVADFLSILGEPPTDGRPETERVEQAVRSVMRAAEFEDDFSLMVARFP